MATRNASIENSYGPAREKYLAIGSDPDKAVKALDRMRISLHCWQGDDVGGLEGGEAGLDGGLAATGNYPGKARTGDELRQDLDKAFSLIPGRHRLNLHALYAEPGKKKVDRDSLEPEHFKTWIAWAKARGLGLDFNPSLFKHPKAASGFTLSNPDSGIRSFWVDHAVACRRIGAHFGKMLGTPCVTNLWIPDGCKDVPADRKAPRMRLKESLDRIFRERIPERFNLDAVESKLFGIGSESYVVGSHEFYMGYAMKNGVMLCLDTGHFHPTETVSDKISSILAFMSRVLLHVSRGVRWDSDHVVTLSDELRAIAEEIVRGGYEERVHIGLDYFDASINRIAAWTIGGRNMMKALLLALLEPTKKLRELELDGDFGSRLALLEELKSLPFGAVWDHYCLKKGVPVGLAWMDEVKSYEKSVLSRRG